MTVDEIKGLTTAFLSVVEVITNKQISDNKYKVNYLYGLLKERLEKEIGGMSNLDESIISEQMGNISKHVEDGLVDIGIGIVWRTSGIRITEKHLDDIGNVFAGLSKTSGIISRIESMTNYTFAAVDLYGMSLGQENIGRVSYFNAYINFRGLNEMAFRAAIDSAFFTIVESYPLTKLLNSLSWINGKDSWTSHRADIDRWGEYIYQLGQYQNQDFHSYDTVKHPHSCTIDGYTKYDCVYCDKTFIDNIVKAPGHKYVKSIVAPTCENQGYDLYKCKNCGDSYKNKYKDSLGHSVYKQEVIVPTCTEDGYTLNYCKCGYEWVSDEKNALQHNYASTVVEHTETKQGYTINECLYCGDVYYSNYVDPTGHIYNVTETKASCEQDGVIIHTCDCGEIYTETIPAKGHTYILSTYVLPTCTKTGFKTYKCENCDSTYTETFDVVVHDYTYKVEITEPTCSEQGYSTNYCACGVTTITDYTVASGHSYEITETVDASCTSEGSVTSKCSACGVVTTEKIHALGEGHVFELIKSSNLDCVSNQFELYECSTCGTQKYENVVLTEGHTYDTCETVYPTCTETGTCTYVCTTCNENIIETLPAIGHTKGEWEYSNSDIENEMVRKCTACGEITETSAEIHSITWNINGNILVDYLPTGTVIAPPSTVAPAGYTFSHWYPSTPPFAITEENLSFTAVFINENESIYVADEYSFSSDGITATIDSYWGTDTNVCLPETVVGFSVTGTNVNVFPENVLQVTIPASITNINTYTFNSATNLQKIVVDKKNTTYTDINGVLYSKDKSTLVRLPIAYQDTFDFEDNITIIGDNAFQKCKNLISVVIPNSVTSIGAYAFSGCSNLTSISIPDNLMSISFAAFSNCTSLSYVTIPDSVTSIDDDAFCGCFSLTSVKIGKNVTDIGDYAFEDCTSLTTVTIPDSVTEIGAYAFRYCSNLVEINLPNSDVAIKKYAFAETGITEITLPENVVSIGNYAFSNCENLQKINYNASNCSMEATNIFTAMLNHPFKNSSNITEVTIGESVESIPSQMFYGRSSITSVYITDLKHWCSIDFKGTNANPLSVAENFYLNDELVTDLVIPEGVKTINNYAFYKGACFDSVTIPNSVTSIGTLAFAYCDGLTSVTVPASVSSIGAQAFRYCDYLNTVVLEDGITSIGANTFADCPVLANIEIPNSVKTIDTTAFTNNTKTAIICQQNSTAHTFAVDNNIPFMANDDNTMVDLSKKVIQTSCLNSKISDIMALSSGLSYSINSDVSGTGVLVDVMKGVVLHSKFTLVVNGDTNGDSICDALDCFEVERAANGNTDLTDVYAIAADSNSDDAVDIIDYQAIVNKALTS